MVVRRVWIRSERCRWAGRPRPERPPADVRTPHADGAGVAGSTRVPTTLCAPPWIAATFAALIVLAGGGCAAPDAPPPDVRQGAGTADGAPFEELAAAVGLDFVHFNGMTGELYLPENVGSGCALFDYDNDGDLDVYLVQGALFDDGKPHAAARFPWRGEMPPRDRLYRNDLAAGPAGRPVLRFTDVTSASGIDAPGYGMGVAAGDFDNDGFVDLYVTNLGPNQLWKNNGDGRFEDVTARAGVDDPWWSVSAAFVDVDADGWLDLYVGDYLNWNPEINKDCFGPTGVEDYCSPSSYLPIPDRLFMNRGDGTFRDATAASGVGAEKGSALGVIAADFDRDGRLDLYVANDGLPNYCWMNRGGGRLENTALLAGCALNGDGKAEASMGVDAADLDEDGDEDLFMAHLTGESNTLYVNDGRGMFEDRSVRMGLGPASQPFTGFGAAWFDQDNDGWLDLLVVNGAVKTIEALAAAGDPYPLHQPNQLFRNQGEGRYRDVSAEAGEALALSEVSRGAAFGDVDNDGDTDVLITNNAGPVRLLSNRLGNRKAWIGLRLVTGTPGRDALGAWVGVTGSGGRTLWRRVRSAASYASANDPRLLVGLADQRGPARVVVHWPDGGVERWSDVPTGTYTELKQGSGREGPP